MVSPDTFRVFTSKFYDLSQTKDSKEVLALIPKDTSVAATNNLGAQLAHRQDLVFLTNCIDDPNKWGNDGKRCFILKPEYIVGDFTQDNGSNNYYPDYSRDLLLKYIDTLIYKGEYSLLKEQNKVLLLKRNYNPS
jgi:hypothetical protein